jgi:xylose isomerase
MVGVNPEVAHEQMVVSILCTTWRRLGCWEVIPYRPERSISGRFDQDLRFGSRDIKAAFYLVKFLEDVGYAGPRHFDAHAYRTEDYEGVKDFARGCMRTYLILKEKAERFYADPEFKRCLQRSIQMIKACPLSWRVFDKKAAALKNQTFDRIAIASRGLKYERLDH